MFINVYFRRWKREKKRDKESDGTFGSLTKRYKKGN